MRAAARRRGRQKRPVATTGTRALEARPAAQARLASLLLDSGQGASDKEAMPDFWRACGYHLLERDSAGHLQVTDDFLRAYLIRPELRPVAESCSAERELHAALLDNPRLPIPAERLAGLADGDARDNYRALLAFRDRLIAARTLERSYRAVFDEERVTLAPLFLDHLAQVILRGILGEGTDGLRARAAELLFRPQRVTLVEGAIMVADAETVDRYAETGELGALGALVRTAHMPVAEVELEVLDEANAPLYFGRDERHDLALDLSFARPGLDALARVLEAWVEHFLGHAVSIQPVERISDERWVWHSGLDAASSRLLNELYAGAEAEPSRLEQLLALFRLEFADPTVMRPDIAGRPVYLGLAMTPGRILRLKPQNLLVNLPLTRPA